MALNGLLGEAPDETPRQLYDKLGRALHARGRHGDAANAFERALGEKGDDPQTADIVLALAAAHVGAGESGLALRVLLSAVSEDPGALVLLQVAHDLLTRETAAAERPWLTEEWSRAEEIDLEGASGALFALLKGRVSLYIEDDREALRHFQRAYDLDSTDARILEGLGEASCRTGAGEHGAKLLAEAQRIAEQGSHPERIPSIAAKRAQALAASGEYAAALELIERFSAGVEARFAYELLCAKSECCLALGRPEEAIEAAERAIAERPALARPHIARSEALIALGRHREALEGIEEALQYEPTNREVQLVKAQVLLEGQLDLDQGRRLLALWAERNGSAISISTRVSASLASRAGDGNAHYFQAEILHVLKNADAALREVDRALECGLVPSESVPAAATAPAAPARRLKGEGLAMAGRTEAAAAELRAAGSAFSDRDEYQAAVDVFERATELDAGEASSYWDLSDALRLAAARPVFPYADPELVERALGVWERGYRMRPPSEEEAWAYLSHAFSLDLVALAFREQREDHWWAGVLDLERYLIVNPNGLAALSQLSRAYRLLGKHALAVSAADAALKVDETYAGALEERALALFNSEHPDASDAIASLQVVEGSDKSLAGLMQGRTLAAQGRYDEAVEAFMAALKESPEDQQLRSELARALRLSGREQESRLEYERVGQASAEGTASEQSEHYAAWVLYQQGAVEEAARRFVQLLDHVETEPFFMRMNIALCMTVLGRAEESQTQLEGALGHRHTRADITDTMLDLAELATRLHDGPALSLLASHRRRLERERESTPIPRFDAEGAAAELAAAPEQEPGSTRWFAAKGALGRLSRSVEDFSAAVATYVEIVQQDAAQAPPLFTEARRALGAMLDLETLETNTVAAAVDCLQATARTQAEEQEALRRRADLLLSTGSIDQGIETCLKALAGLGDESRSSEAGASLHARLALARSWQLDLPGALDELRRCLAIQLAALDGPAAAKPSVDDATYSAGRMIEDAVDRAHALIDSAPRYDVFAEALAILSKDPPDQHCTPGLLKTRLNVARNMYRRVVPSPEEADSVAADLPVVTPITLAADARLFPQMEKTPEVVRMLEEDIPAMKQRIHDDLGLAIPGVRIGPLENTYAGAYILSLNEVPLAVGAVSSEEVFCPERVERDEAGEQSRPGRDPLDGAVGTWIQASKRADAQQQGWVVRDAYEMMLRHLERLVREHVALFMGLTELENMLEEWVQPDGSRRTLLEEALPDDAARRQLDAVLCGLLEEQVPIVELERILRVFAAERHKGLQAGDLVGRIRTALSTPAEVAATEDVVAAAPDSERQAESQTL